MLKNLFSAIMEQPPWGSQLQSKGEEQDSGGESTWKKIKDSATLKEIQNVQTSFLPRT